jgi:hypothetical protein
MRFTNCEEDVIGKISPYTTTEAAFANTPGRTMTEEEGLGLKPFTLAEFRKYIVAEARTKGAVRIEYQMHGDDVAALTAILVRPGSKNLYYTYLGERCGTYQTYPK